MSFRGTRWRWALLVCVAGVAAWAGLRPLWLWHEVRSRVYRIGWESVPPLQLEGGNGQPTGLAVELLKEAARRRGIRLKWVRTSQGAEASLRSHSVDLWPLMIITEERKKVIHFSEPYLVSEHAFLVRAGARLGSVDELAHAAISFLDLPINRQMLRGQFPGASLVGRPSSRGLIDDVCRGASDAAFLEEYTAVNAMLGGASCALPLRLLPDLKDLTPRLGIGSTFEADAAADTLREEIGDLAANGEVSAILAQWSYFSAHRLESLTNMLVARKRERYWIAGVSASACLLLLALWQTLRSMRERRKARLAEEALRSSETRSRTIVANLGEGVGIVDAEERFVEANAAAEEIFHAGPGGLKGRSLLDFLAPEARQAELRERHGRRERERTSYEIGIARPDGQLRRLLVSSAPLPSGKGFAGTVRIFRDVTEARGMEERIRLLAQALESASECISVTDADDRVLYVNRAFLETYGYAESELIGRDISIVRAEGNPPGLGDEIRPATARGGWRGEIWNITKDGRRFPIELATSAMRDENGTILALIGVASDITDRRRADEALRESLAQAREANQQLRFQFERMPLAYIVWDTGFRVREWNPAAERIFGWPASEAVGKAGPELIVPPEVRPAVQEIWQALLRGEQSSYSVNENLARDGRLLICEWINSPLRDASGAVSGVLSMVRDITERRRAERERAELAEQLELARRLDSVGRLAGGVAHDFNNLLTLVNGYSDLLLLKMEDGNPHRAMVQQIRSAGDRATNLTQQLLAFGRKQLMRPEPLHLNDVIAESEEMLRRLVGEDIETSFDLAPDLGSVLADSGQIHQVLLNLVLNARDAMGAGGRLRVETCNVDVKAGRDGHKAPPGSYVLLSVADSGVGMDEATLDRIFEPFFTTKAKGAGTGLGLPTVHGIVRQNEGWITVESRVGQGTRMNIYLPRLQEDALAREVAPMVAEAAAGSETILVVEDEEALRRLAVDALSGQGYRVLEADGGQAGLDRARAHAGPIHLLLTDVVMPGMNGRELAERLRAQRPELRVLFMSGWAEEVIAHRGVLDQGVAFLAKPFSPVDLAARIRAVLGSAARG